MCQLCYQATPQISFSPVYGVLSGSALTQHFINDLPAADHFEGSDAAASTGTSYTISLGDTFEGEISNGSDVDWVAINLTAGESVVISAYGTNGGINGIEDTTLTLYDSNGNEVAYNDDAFAAGFNFFSLIEYTVPATGTYYIGVAGLNGTPSLNGTGDYIIRTTTDDFRIEDIVSQLTEFGWGIPTALGHDENTGDVILVHIANLTAAGQQLALQALEQWSIVTGITFAVTGNIGSADIRFDDDSSGAFAGPSNFDASTGVINFSDVNVGTGWLNTYGTTVDSYSFLTYMHEIGHALGLVHSGNYDGFANWGVNNHFNNDSTIFTIMSYFDMDESGFAPYANVITPMIADIAAVWALYGEPVSVYGANTTWFANSNIAGLTGNIMGAVWDGDSISSSIYQGGAVSLTVLDTGGIDTFDFSTVSVAQTIDLREGHISLVGSNGGGLTNNSFVIAQGTVIENVIGGSGNDDIVGNDANNHIQGLGGDDWYYESLGDDTFVGGNGTDRVIYIIDSSGITVTDMGGGTIQVTSSLGTDTYTGVEFYDFSDGVMTQAEMLALAGGPIEGDENPNALDGGAGDDQIFGYGGNDTLNGFGGDDEILGGTGDDTINGGDGDDILNGEAGNDQINGGADEDRVIGGSGNDVLSGAAGNDLMWGGTENDTMFGDDGNDTMYGEFGNDAMDGGFGNDRIEAGFGNDEAYGGAGNDTMFGGQGIDLLNGQDGDDTIDGGTDIDRVIGGAGNDILSGGTGNDLMWGGADNDTMNGDDGNDTMYGEFGNDTMDGGTGNDRIEAGFGNDVAYGGAGNDTMFGGQGIDLLNGQDGDDTIEGGTDIDRIIGGAGFDTLRGGSGNDLMWGGANGDTMYGDEGNDTMYGETGSDTMLGGDGRDTIHGGQGIDILNGQDGNDTIYGGGDDDSIIGGAGTDMLFGDDGADQIFGGADNDTIDGGAGRDFIFGETGNDVALGGDGDDTIYGGSGIDTLNGQAGDDQVEGGDDADRVIGGSGDDRLFGGEGNDQVWGGADDDYIEGGNGTDTLYGEAGSDFLDGGADDDIVIGGRGNDLMWGGNGADEFVFTGMAVGEVDGIADYLGIEGDFMTLGSVAGATDQQRFDNLAITQVGTDVDISWNGATVILYDYDASDLTVDDFNFV